MLKEEKPIEFPNASALKKAEFSIFSMKEDVKQIRKEIACFDYDFDLGMEFFFFFFILWGFFLNLFFLFFLFFLLIL